MKEQATKIEEDKRKNLVVTFRVFQSLFFGLFALGISLIFGDISKAVEFPVSSFSITTTIFGIIGAIITGNLANKCKDW
jgi:hypothetical protein